MSSLSTLDIANLPPSEDERFEFKSSRLDMNGLKEKLVRAGSGFSNSGGGIFIAGVDGGGKPDGGIPKVVGRQSIRDWIDQALQLIAPQTSYSKAWNYR